MLLTLLLIIIACYISQQKKMEKLHMKQILLKQKLTMQLEKEIKYPIIQLEEKNNYPIIQLKIENQSQ